MRFNQKVQAGLLFSLYLSRAGRASISSISEGTGVSAHFLEQIARTLRIHGVVKSIRGPGGGYELVGEPTVLKVISSLGYEPILYANEIQKLSVGQQEHRAIALLADDLFSYTKDILIVPLRDLIGILNDYEEDMFNGEPVSLENN